MLASGGHQGRCAICQHPTSARRTRKRGMRGLLGSSVSPTGSLLERGAMERQRVVVTELRVDTNHTLNPLCWKTRHSVCWKELCRDGVTRLAGRHHWWGFGITLRCKPSAPRRQQGLSLSP